MKNFNHKFAVASVCTALNFALGANKEAKAATFTLSFPETQFFIEDRYSQNGSGIDGVGDTFVSPNNSDPSTLPSVVKRGDTVSGRVDIERRAFYEFNIGSLSLAPNTVIRSAIFQASMQEAIPFSYPWRLLYLDIFGYVGNGKPDLSDFSAGVRLDSENPLMTIVPLTFLKDVVDFDVTGFVNERASNRDNFAGLGIRVAKSGIEQHGIYNYGQVTFTPSLIIETTDIAQPVPEPTTIFGSALALGIGGWLKRKKSSQQNKRTSQH